MMFFEHFSDRNAMGKFSSLFFGKTEQQLPFTDSDGLYDFPSSDGKGGIAATQHKKSSSGRRRERKSSRAGNYFVYRPDFPLFGYKIVNLNIVVNVGSVFS